MAEDVPAGESGGWVSVEVFPVADITIGRRIDYKHEWSMAEEPLLGNEAGNEAMGSRSWLGRNNTPYSFPTYGQQYN